MRLYRVYDNIRFILKIDLTYITIGKIYNYENNYWYININNMYCGKDTYKDIDYDDFQIINNRYWL